MRFQLITRSTFIAGTVAALCSGSAMGHISLNSPNGGEIVTMGSILEIEWQINIAHNQNNWDIWYSTESPAGGWIEIVMDLDPGSTSSGSIHTYGWTVPEFTADDVWVRVRMDNNGTDYFDVSASSFAIVPAPGTAGLFGIASLGALRRRR